MFVSLVGLDADLSYFWSLTYDSGHCSTALDCSHVQSLESDRGSMAAFIQIAYIKSPQEQDSNEALGL